MHARHNTVQKSSYSLAQEHIVKSFIYNNYSCTHEACHAYKPAATRVFDKSLWRTIGPMRTPIDPS